MFVREKRTSKRVLEWLCAQVIINFGSIVTFVNRDEERISDRLDPGRLGKSVIAEELINVLGSVDLAGKDYRVQAVKLLWQLP